MGYANDIKESPSNADQGSFPGSPWNLYPFTSGFSARCEGITQNSMYNWRSAGTLSDVNSAPFASPLRLKTARTYYYQRWPQLPSMEHIWAPLRFATKLGFGLRDTFGALIRSWTCIKACILHARELLQGQPDNDRREAQLGSYPRLNLALSSQRMGFDQKIFIREK